MLVAVVKLSASQEPIQRNNQILWGEIVAYDLKDGPNLDWSHRAKGFEIYLKFINTSYLI